METPDRWLLSYCACWGGSTRSGKAPFRCPRPHSLPSLPILLTSVHPSTSSPAPSIPLSPLPPPSLPAPSTSPHLPPPPPPLRFACNWLWNPIRNWSWDPFNSDNHPSKRDLSSDCTLRARSVPMRAWTRTPQTRCVACSVWAWSQTTGWVLQQGAKSTWVSLNTERFGPDTNGRVQEPRECPYVPAEWGKNGTHLQAWIVLTWEKLLLVNKLGERKCSSVLLLRPRNSAQAECTTHPQHSRLPFISLFPKQRQNSSLDGALFFESAVRGSRAVMGQ